MEKKKPVFLFVTIPLFIALVTLLVLTVLNLNSNDQSAAVKENFITGLVTVGPGLGDKGFNDGVFNGLKMAKEQYNVLYNIIETKEQSNYYENLIKLSDQGTDLVFAVGFIMQEAVNEVARDRQNTFFAGIDIEASPDSPKNYMGVVFSENEASYLAGIVAGLMTKQYASSTPKLNDKNIIAVVLGMDVPPVKRYEAGYFTGAKSVNPDVEILSATIGDFYSESKGKEVALSMIDMGADIIFHAAGLTGLGVIEACKERGVLAIGVDVDQNSIAPDTVLTSAEKKITQATFLAVESVYNGKFIDGTRRFTIKDDAVGLSDFHSFDSIVPQEVKDAVSIAKDDIKSGRVVVPETK